MAIDTTKFITYIARGIPNTQVAAAFGITPGRVTQLRDNPKVATLIEAKRKELAIAEIEDQTTLGDARTSLLARLPDLISSTDSLSEAVNALEKLHRLKEPGPSTNTNAPKTLVSLELPAFLQAKLSIELSSRNEITEIDGRSMATLPTDATRTLLTQGQPTHNPPKDNHNDSNPAAEDAN